jgi:hypothetical protein
MGLGWGTFFGGIGKILDKLPIQGRKERWKNEIDNLTKEKEQILKGECDAKKASRIEWINSRITYLNQLLKNSASD